MFPLLLISSPWLLPHEHHVLARLFEAGLPTLHLRKPGASRAEMEAYLRAVPREFHGRIMLHQHHELARDYALQGLHLPAATREAWRGTPAPGQLLSTSFHSLEEVERHRRRYHHVFLSPIFNSISKVGYSAAFQPQELQAALARWAARPAFRPQVVALGGIDASTLGPVRQLGFAGAAVLGAIWQHPDPVGVFRELQQLAAQPL
ncbi:thiamine phosphate synthase [Hymenobacter chitinivorans]|uniref:Thiamine-phosphate pyrophosphorylase n=1 Tax=Hymenobacter chitinivorans DSM 11115 TaxID=1121954 RepID=A0A2M9B5A5_9BACT|nr:thiamine phosphate synthase [Hymenobacter chitinivorans]PJJ53105.1 thiamine-phosphate pyrophosphorylase [Hymenobacter chitinivorans DSM 11115]